MMIFSEIEKEGVKLRCPALDREHSTCATLR